MVSQFSTINSGINKKRDLQQQKRSRIRTLLIFLSAFKERPIFGSNFCQVIQILGCPRKDCWVLYKFSTPVSSSFCKTGSQGVACNELEEQMEWGHPLVGPGRVQGAGQWFGRIHRAAARNPLRPLSPPLPSHSRSNLPQPSPNASPSHRPGPGPHKPGLLMPRQQFYCSEVSKVRIPHQQG